MEEKFLKYINKIKRLAQYKDFSDVDLEAIAKKHFEKTDLETELEKTIGSDKEEQLEAKKRFEAYLAEFPILENEIEKNGLIRLIYLEIIGLRLQKVLNQDTALVPTHTFENLCSNNDEINKQKIVLGLIKKENSEETEIHKILNELIRRQHEFINLAENRANYTYRCGHCGKLMLIRRRLDKEIDSVIIHPMFIAGGVLFNAHVFKLFDEGKITDEDVAAILDVKQVDYRLWLYKQYKNEIEYYKKSHKHDKEV
jgi:hypothetical protein